MNFKKIFTLIFITFLLFINIYTFSYADQSLNITAESVVLIDSISGKILYSKNKDELKYPASTTKILTAILTIENCNLDDVITASSTAINSIPSGYSNAAIQVGEKLTVKELLEVFLIHSANEAGYILAENISGSIENFANLMNTKAMEIGCTNTHFTNPSGLQDVNHYTTAYDLSLIARYCMQNDTFRQIVKQPSCTITATDKYEERYFLNTNELLNKTSPYYNEHVIGIKTGFTTQARNCLISAYKENNIELISVVLDAPQSNSSGDSAKYTDTLTLFKYGIENFSIKTIAQRNYVMKKIAVLNATSKTKDLDLVISNDISVLISNSVDINSIEPDIKLNDNILAPISQNDVLGTISYTVDGITYTENLIASHSVEASNFFINIIKIAIAILLLIIAFKLMYLNTRNTNKKKKKKKKQTIHGKYLYGGKF